MSVGQHDISYNDQSGAEALSPEARQRINAQAFKPTCYCISDDLCGPRIEQSIMAEGHIQRINNPAEAIPTKGWVVVYRLMIAYGADHQGATRVIARWRALIHKPSMMIRHPEETINIIVGLCRDVTAAFISPALSEHTKPIG